MEYKQMLPDYESHCRDESRVAGTATAIVFPWDTEEAAQAVKYAAGEQMPLTLQGARTGVAAGAVPRGGLVLSTQRMSRLLGLRRDDAGGWFLRAQAGATLEQVQAFLRRPLPEDNWPEAEKQLCAEMGKGPRQMFAPNPTEATASLGGLFATNAQGMNALRYGGMGAQVQALTWVAPGGDVWRINRREYCFDTEGCPLPGGGRLYCPTGVPADGVALLHPAPGLDLIDFLAGSEGLVGLATEVELRLQPAPGESWGVVYFFTDDETAQAFAAALARWHKETPGLLSAAEYYDEAVLGLVADGKDKLAALKTLAPVPNGAKAALYVVLQGDDAGALEQALGDHLTLFEDAGGGEEDNWAAMGEAEMESFNTLRHSVPELVNLQVDAIRLEYPAFYKMATDFQGPPALAGEYCALYHRGIAESGLQGYVFGHMLDNRLHVNLLARSEAEQEQCRLLMTGWAQRVAADGGLLAGENGFGRLRMPLYDDLVPPRRKAQLKAILQALDPAGLLAQVI